MPLIFICQGKEACVFYKTKPNCYKWFRKLSLQLGSAQATLALMPYASLSPLMGLSSEDGALSILGNKELLFSRREFAFCERQ